MQDQLRGEAIRQGKEAQFERLKGLLVGEDSEVGYRKLASELGTARAPSRWPFIACGSGSSGCFEEEIAHTVVDPREIGGELRELFTAIRM